MCRYRALEASLIPNSEPAFSHQNTAKLAGLNNLGIFFEAHTQVSMHDSNGLKTKILEYSTLHEYLHKFFIKRILMFM